MMAEEAALYRQAISESGGLSTSEAIKFAKFDIHSSSIFYSSASQLTVGFVNLKPLLPGHVLLVPRRIVARMAELSEEEVDDLFRSVYFVMPIVCAKYGASSANIGIQDGVDAGQSVPHVHVHIIPRQAVQKKAVVPDAPPAVTLEQAKNILNTAYEKFSDPETKRKLKDLVEEANKEEDPMKRQMNMMSNITPEVTKLMSDEIKQYGFTEANMMMGVMQVQMMAQSDPDMKPKADELAKALQGKFSE